MKKTLISVLLLVVLIFNVVAFTGCSFLGDGGKTTIVFYHTMGANLQGILNEHIEEFNRLYPNIVVEHSSQGSYDDLRKKIEVELTVGGGPNIAYCYPDHVAGYNVSKSVATLDQFINSTKTVERADGTTEQLGFTEAQIADFIPGYYNEGKQFGDELMYTLPFFKSTELLYYNKTFFEENKDHIQVPTTWEEMEEVCRWIKEQIPNSCPLGYDSEANWFITMTEQLGTPYTSAEKVYTSAEDVNGTHFLFDTKENREFVSEFREWYQDGLVTTEEILGSYTSNIFVLEDGADNKSYMSIGSSAGATYQRPAKDDSTGEYPFEVGITSIPQVDPKNPKVISQGPSICMFNSTPEKMEASWLFMKFLTTSVAFQADFSRTSGYVPVIKSVNTDPIYAQFLAKADGGNYIAALSAQVCLDQADAYYTSPAFNGSSDARDEVGALMQKCLTFEATPATDIASEIKKLFEKAISNCEYNQ